MTVLQLVPEKKTVDTETLFSQLDNEYPIGVFDDLVIEFSNDFSKKILRNQVINRIPAYVALAYWLRKSNMKRIIAENQGNANNDRIQLSPLGTIFHICPSNVDTMFIYSLFVALLAGNKNVLRISSRIQDAGMNQIFVLFGGLLEDEKYKKLKGYIRVFSYERNTEINRLFSKNADGRIIWGGDETIRTFKTLTDNPRSRDLVFSDRQSLALFKTAYFNQLGMAEKSTVVKQFFNDAYSFDQKGCSSPQIVLTYGSLSDKETFQNDFYQILEGIVSENYDYDAASIASMKMNQLAIDAVDETISGYYGPNKNLIMAEMNSSVINHACGGGYFYLKNLSDLFEISDFTHKKIQTLTYFGLNSSEKETILQLSNGKGIERLVPVGEGLSFDYIWDGYNLINELITKKYVN